MWRKTVFHLRVDCNDDDIIRYIGSVFAVDECSIVDYDQVRDCCKPTLDIQNEQGQYFHPHALHSNRNHYAIEHYASNPGQYGMGPVRKSNKELSGSNQAILRIDQ